MMILVHERTTADRMDRLPCELLQYILRYIDQPLDLFRMSCICSRWRSWIMNDEYFLNQWFSRLLKRSRKCYSCAFASYTGDCKPPWKLDLDESLYPVNLRPNCFHFLPWLLNLDGSLFPINLRSSNCDFLPWIVSRSSSDYEDLYEHDYSLSLCDSSHSFSLWLFLPRHCQLNIQVGNCNVKGLNISLCSDEKYHFDNGESVSIVDRWIHIVLNKIDSQSNYQICIDGQYLTKLSQCQISLNTLNQYFSLFNILLCRTFDNNPLDITNQARIADLNAFKRCLTLVEIRAIHQQQTSISQVKVGTYINSH
jgi:hypothetical protein